MHPTAPKNLRALVGTLLLLVLCSSSLLAQDLSWAFSIGQSQADNAHGIATDASGNVWVTGTFRGSSVDFDPGAGTATLPYQSSGDIYVAKYDVTGNYLLGFSLTGGNTNFPTQLVMDSPGSKSTWPRYTPAR